MNIDYIIQYIAKNIFTVGPNVSATEIVVNKNDIFIKSENYILNEEDKIYIFSQNNGAVTIAEK